MPKTELENTSMKAHTEFGNYKLEVLHDLTGFEPDVVIVQEINLKRGEIFWYGKVDELREKGWIMSPWKENSLLRCHPYSHGEPFFLDEKMVAWITKAIDLMDEYHQKFKVVL